MMPSGMGASTPLRVRIKEEEQTLASNKKVSKEQAKLLSECFNNVRWTWNYTVKDVNALDNGRKIPQAILQLVRQAQESQNKLAKEAMVLIKGWTEDGHQDRFMKLKRGHATCTQNLAKLGHMVEFKELPDELEPTKANLDKLMQEMAIHTRDYNELIETTRGIVRSKKN